MGMDGCPTRTAQDEEILVRLLFINPQQHLKRIQRTHYFFSPLEELLNSIVQTPGANGASLPKLQTQP